MPSEYLRPEISSVMIMWIQLHWQLHRWQHRGAGNRLHLKDDDCISCRYSRELSNFLLIFPALYFHVIFFHCLVMFILIYFHFPWIFHLIYRKWFSAYCQYFTTGLFLHCFVSLKITTTIQNWLCSWFTFGSDRAMTIFGAFFCPENYGHSFSTFWFQILWCLH